jgi:hypothetical protein
VKSVDESPTTPITGLSFNVATELTVLKWNVNAASAAGARHFCGEARAQVYISRWFESICSPPKADFTKPASLKHD